MSSRRSTPTASSDSDLRFPTIIVCGDKLYWVDLADWGGNPGKEGGATPPDIRLRLIVREGRGDVRITKANDVRVLDDAKELLKGEIEKKRGENTTRSLASRIYCPSQIVY